MKIGILYICTGKYSTFWKEFYESAQSLLLPGYDKEYFIFTDDEQLLYKDKKNVHIFFQEKQEWPFPTLMRFHTFLRVEEQLREMDYVFYFNANMKFVTEIKPVELLPDPAAEDGLTVVLHSGYYKASPEQLPYERKQIKSLAYLSKGQHYFQGCLNGGTSEAYLQMIRQLKNNVQADLDNNIIAVWHDESHLNRYMADKHPKILSPAFSFPEGQSFDFSARILMLDKSRLGGHGYMRGQKEGLVKRISRAIKKLLK